MNKNEALKYYKLHREKLNAYGLVMSTAYFDKSTIAPKGGNKYRNKMFSLMDGELFKLETDEKYVEAVKVLSESKLDETMTREIYLTKKNLDDLLKFTKEEEMAFSLACMDSTDAWEVAKEKSDYSLFKNHLEKIINLRIERAKKRNPKVKPYNLYLDDYEENMTIKDYDKFFNLIKKELVPLIKKVSAKKNYIDDSFLYKFYPKDKQALFMQDLCKYLGFDKSWGYMGVSVHPFTNGLSSDDVRITTAYDENDVTAAIYSVIHETGHAYYEHQVDKKYEGTMIKRAISSGMHESQSRFLENYIGRRPAFFKNLYKCLEELYPENLGEVTFDDFMKAVNVSRPSLIRTAADELTYPIHILIRYEIEKGIFDGSIDIKKLDKIWNQKYREYLGVKVPSDAKGILQDIHWSDGSFGYFPTYALGSAIGAQILHKMEQDLNIDELLEEGKLKVIMKYLKDNLQKYGALYDYKTLLKNFTGEEFNPKYYVKYLKDKYTKLYDL